MPRAAGQGFALPRGLAVYGQDHVADVQRLGGAHFRGRAPQLLQMPVGLGIVARHGVDGRAELAGRLLGSALPGQQHSQIVVGPALVGGRLEMLLGLAQPSLLHEDHAQIVVGQLEFRIQAQRPGERLRGL
ncbi:hypothetical protein AAU61_18105 [Desulfocarbo indianensis]|nr:hypothetical protein AAU61_18105 [Desulfocarbo indianensis]